MGDGEAPQLLGIALLVRCARHLDRVAAPIPRGRPTRDVLDVRIGCLRRLVFAIRTPERSSRAAGRKLRSIAPTATECPLPNHADVSSPWYRCGNLGWSGEHCAERMTAAPSLMLQVTRDLFEHAAGWRPQFSSRTRSSRPGVRVTGAVYLFAQRRGPAPSPTRVDGYRVVKAYPHDAQAYTQGLIYRGGVLYESTGQHGRSTLRKVKLETGEVLQQRRIDNAHFAEGLTEGRAAFYSSLAVERRVRLRPREFAPARR